jgi:hypothetical protein
MGLSLMVFLVLECVKPVSLVTMLQEQSSVSFFSSLTTLVRSRRNASTALRCVSEMLITDTLQHLLLGVLVTMGKIYPTPPTSPPLALPEE